MRLWEVTMATGSRYRYTDAQRMFLVTLYYRGLVEEVGRMAFTFSRHDSLRFCRMGYFEGQGVQKSITGYRENEKHHNR